MSTEQSEPPVDARILLAGIAGFGVAVLAAYFGPFDLYLMIRGAVFWLLAFGYKALLSLFVSVVTTLIVMVVGVALLGGILAVLRLAGSLAE